LPIEAEGQIDRDPAIRMQTAVRTLLINQETDSVRFLSPLNQVIYENVQRISPMVLNRLSVGANEEVLIVRANGFD
jgi:hypothetical protein